MPKLTLDLESLRVESFAVDETSPAQTGTVHGQSVIEDPDAGSDLCGTGGAGPTQTTCIGPTYCCPHSWRPTCIPSCNGISCFDPICWY